MNIIIFKWLLWGGDKTLLSNIPGIIYLLISIFLHLIYSCGKCILWITFPTTIKIYTYINDDGITGTYKVYIFVLLHVMFNILHHILYDSIVVRMWHDFIFRIVNITCRNCVNVPVKYSITIIYSWYYSETCEINI